MYIGLVYDSGDTGNCDTRLLASATSLVALVNQLQQTMVVVPLGTRRTKTDRTQIHLRDDSSQWVPIACLL